MGLGVVFGYLFCFKRDWVELFNGEYKRFWYKNIFFGEEKLF